MSNLIPHLFAALIGLTLLLAGCDQKLASWRTEKLVVIVPEIAQGSEAEFERELARLFSEQLHVVLETIPMRQDKIRAALANHQAHLTAATLRSESTTTALQFGPAYQSVRELMVCNRDFPRPKNLADLAGRKLAVVANSAQEVALREAQENFPGLQWQSNPTFTTKELLAEVDEGTLDCVAANELQLADARNYHPDLIAALEIGPPSKLAWGFPMDADPELLKQTQLFFDRIRRDGTLNRLLDRYYGHNNQLGKTDAAAFISRTKTVLPRYRRLFEEAAELTGQDWRLLAALAYQESHWNPLATSYTNVRGMMMLTEDTADQMKVSNRLDARESILAGAQYLLLLKEQMPDRIPEPDRTWLALAAYNQGYSHMEDARILTQRAGLNPDRWLNVKKWMPLLDQPIYYETLKYGYARGGEAVILVENVRGYYGLLRHMEPNRTHASDAISYRLFEPLQSLMR